MPRSFSRPRRAITALALVGALPLILAAGDERPQLTPAHTVSVTYEVEDTGLLAQVLRYASSGERFIAQFPGAPSKTLIIGDRVRRRLVVLHAAEKTYTVQPYTEGDEVQQLILAEDATYKRLGTDELLGLSCTGWAIASPRLETEDCITADGIVLRSRPVLGTGQRGLSAVEVTYVAIPAAAFEVPDGFEEAP